MKRTILLIFISLLSFSYSQIIAQEGKTNNQYHKEEKIYETAEQMPSFPGGDLALLKFINENVKYPYQDEQVQRAVILRFVIEKDSTISNVDVMRSIDPICDKEAVRVIKSMPKWIPGKQNNEPVRVYYTLPVRFRLY